MSYRFKASKDSPSTPNRKKLFQSNPSTTPAGPPPSHLTQASTTPAGPPPRSSFFSSNAANNTFGRRGNTPGRRGFAVPSSSPPMHDEDEDEDEDEDAEGEEEDVMDTTEQSMQHAPEPTNSEFMTSVASGPRGLKRSRSGQVREQVGEDYARIARGVTGAPSASVEEPDELLLQQEAILSQMEAGKELESAQEGATQLTRLWAKHADPTTKEGKLGPEAEDPFTQANYLSSLLLQVHHPHRLTARKPHAQRTQALAKRSSPDACTVPRALLDWLEIYHNPFPDDHDAIKEFQPAPSAHDRFWDAIYASLVRGRFQQAITLFRNAGWHCAYTAEEDSQPDGYSDRQLANTEEVAERAARLLESCPALRYGDWDVKDADWTLFRQRVRQAVKELERLAGEGDGEDAAPLKASGNVFSMSAATKRAESKVPWSVYTNLKLSYDILLGNADEIQDASQDWLEASIYITAWWNGEDDYGPNGAVGVGKGSLKKSLGGGTQKMREVDVTPASAYRRRLGEAFTFVTDTDDSLFVPDTMDAVQVGLGCVLTGEIEGVVGMLRTSSLPIATAVVEVAALAGWLPQARPRSRGLLEQGFSSEDLMVLSHGPIGAPRQEPGELVRDDLLSEYADALAEKDHLSSAGAEREGWELAVSVLGRMDDEAEGERRITELLDRIDLSDEVRVNKILAACQALELGEQARGIAERFADSLASEPNSQAYGSALIYYARAHAMSKLRSTLALLTSLCLLHSSAIPVEADLDPPLASLLCGNRGALMSLARTDADAATLLAQHVSGYATLRRFYDLRDQKTKGAGALRPLERTREAANALMAVLESAADCIRGGLYDPEVESVVPVDGVLALLGEALPLLGQGKRVFAKEQVFGLLRIVEDLSTAPGRIREDAESLLHASLTAYRDGAARGTGKSQLLKRQRSDLGRSGGLGGSSYDMLASSVMARSGEEESVPIVRGWDWRKGLDKIGGVEIGQKEVLMLVRVALAQEVAKGWSGGLNW